MNRKICVVTGSRADYGYLYCPMRLIQGAPELDLQIAVTGMHLDTAFGETWRLIEEDGFQIDARVNSLVPGDSVQSITKSIGQGVIGFADALQSLAPDFLMVLGDRYEILAAVEAALIARIPVVHLAGGDTSEGAFDESMRHAITKMSHLHFVTNDGSADRVRQMGENPANIHQVGSTSLDYIKQMEFMTREAFFDAIGFTPRNRNLMVTFHPVTLDPTSSISHILELQAALEALGQDIGLIITGPNADTEGRALTKSLTEFAQVQSNAIFCESLGQSLYFNALNQVDAVVGNSSSGLYEAPTFGIPTVNIGDRQKGRLQAESVLDSGPTREAILSVVHDALSRDCSDTVNPYGDGEASPRIISVIETIETPQVLLQKKFFNA